MADDITNQRRIRMAQLRQKAIDEGKPVPAYSTLYMKARSEVDPVYHDMMLEKGRLYMAKKIQDPEFRARHNARVLATNNRRYAEDPAYRAKLIAYQKTRKGLMKTEMQLIEDKVCVMLKESTT